MTERQHIKIVAFVGLAGSGKSEAVKYLTDKGIPKVYFGGVVLNALSDAGLEHTQQNEKKFREEIRQKEGRDFVVNRIIKQIHDLADAGQHHIVADGLYTWTEYKKLKHEFPGEMTVVAVVTPKHLRYERMSKRPVRPLQPHEIDERDWAEIENLEKGGPIAIADYFVHNDKGIDWLYQQLDEVLHHSEFFDN
jgi:dephospho-CoA kinase